MKLSTRSRYGLRLMIALAMSYGGGPRLLKEIADTEELSEKYLGQLVIPLKSAGFISAVRGAKGGYELTRDPEGISPLEIVMCSRVTFLPGKSIPLPVPGRCGQLRSCGKPCGGP